MNTSYTKSPACLSRSVDNASSNIMFGLIGNSPFFIIGCYKILYLTVM
jgi:hypothetical protein